MGIHKDTEILKLLHFLYAVQITLHWHTILFLMHQWLHVNLVRGVILKYTRKIAKKPLKRKLMSTIKRKIRYILSADISSFNFNTKSLILIYKEIYKYVFLKIYRQAYFSTLLNMYLLLYIDTHNPEGSLCAHLLPASLYVLFYFGKGMAFQFICSLSILLQIHPTIVLHQHTQLASVCHLCRFNC